MNLRCVTPRGLVEFDATELLARAAGYAFVHLDAGTGDAMFPYRLARSAPDTLCLALDPVADNMKKVASRLGRKPARGGVENLVLLIGGLEYWPPALFGLVGRLTINFPWGALLRGVAEARPEIMRPAAALLTPGGEFDILLNMQVFGDDPLRERLDLPSLTEEFVDERLRERYAAFGLEITDRRLIGDEPLPARTTWGGRLTRGSRRATLRIQGHRRDEND
ncbi:MAG: hypothetical protein P9L99_20895 [Candidatus Lernaella stagnicola]|nr:hypothetical protein [Candidatus Lernaella stagnicola]